MSDIYINHVIFKIMKKMLKVVWLLLVVLGLYLLFRELTSDNRFLVAGISGLLVITGAVVGNIITSALKKTWSDVIVLTATWTPALLLAQGLSGDSGVCTVGWLAEGFNCFVVPMAAVAFAFVGLVVMVLIALRKE